MAARRLQKLRGDDLSTLAHQSDSSEEEDAPASSPFNAFELLGEEEQDESEQAAEDAGREDAAATAAPRLSSPPAKAARSGKKAKAKHKKASKLSPEAQALPDKQAGLKQAQGSGEDIDAILRELGIEQTPLDRARPKSRRQDEEFYDPLAVDPHRLKSDSELKRIFGARTIREAEKEDGPSARSLEGAPRKIKRLAARGLIKLATFKPGYLITPKDYWPPFNSTLTTEESDYQPPQPDSDVPQPTDGDGYRLRYYHDAHYYMAQQQFETAQGSYDPNQIMQLLAYHPYHVDSLLAIAELQRAWGHHEEADYMIQRAVYALEMAWHSRCNPATGMHITISYDETINRPMFRALFLYAQGLSRRGLHGTALEVSKLLMGLDQRDPMGVIFCINYYALRAHDYAFVQKLARQNTSCPLDLAIPGNAYSYSMAKYLQDRAASNASASTSKAASSRAQDLDGEEETADGQLTRAILLYPLVVSQLIPRLQEQGAAKDAEWNSIMGMPLFAQATDEGSASLGHLTSLYIERHHTLWKNPEVLAWLRRTCRAAADMVAEERDTHVSVSATVRGAGSEAIEHEPLQMAALRKLLFPPGPNAFSHLRLHDFSDSVNALPPEEMNQMLGQGAPGRQEVELRLREDLIPAELLEQLRPLMENGGELDPELFAELREIEMVGRERADGEHARAEPPAPARADAQQRQLQRQRQPPANNILPAVRRVDEDNLRRMHPLVAMLRAFLPWHDVGQQPDYAAPHDDSNQEVPQQAQDQAGP